MAFKKTLPYLNYILPILLSFQCFTLPMYGAEGQQSKLHHLKVLLLPFLSFSPIFIAEEEGFFTQQSLKIEWIKISRGSHALPALIQGKLDVWGGSTSVTILNAIAHGAGVRMVSDKGHLPIEGCPFAALLVRRNIVLSGELPAISHLKGKRISVDLTNFEGYYMEKLLRQGSLTLNDVHVLDISDALLPESMKKGSIDLACTTEPWVTRMLQMGDTTIWIPAQKVIPNFQLASLMYGPSLLQRNLDAGKYFMVAYLKAVRQMNQGKTERNLKIIAKYTGLDQEFLKKVCWPALRDDGRINIESILDFQDRALKKRLVDKIVSQNQFWDTSFIEYANRVLELSKK